MELLYIFLGFIGLVALMAIIGRLCDIIERKITIRKIISIFRESFQKDWDEQHESRLKEDLEKLSMKRLQAVLRINTMSLKRLREKGKC